MRTFEQTTTEQLIRAVKSLMTYSTEAQDYLSTLSKDELRNLICRLA